MLYNLLSDRDAINLLYTLSQKENVQSYQRETAIKLAKHQLILLDESKIAISSKGKAFLKQLDDLGKIITNKKSSVRINYSLKQEEKDILLMLAQNDMKEDAVVRKLRNPFRKKKGVAAIKYLQETHLIEGNGILSITNLGRKTIRNELLDEFNLNE